MKIVSLTIQLLSINQLHIIFNINFSRFMHKSKATMSIRPIARPIPHRSPSLQSSIGAAEAALQLCLSSFPATTPGKDYNRCFMAKPVHALACLVIQNFLYKRVLLVFLNYNTKLLSLIHA